MRPIARSSLVGALAVVLIVIGAVPPSVADSGVGDSTAATGACNGTYVQAGTMGAPSYSVPADGVITSFTIAAPAGSVRAFKLARVLSAYSVYVVAGSAPTTVPASGVLTQTVRFPAHAGDVLGMLANDNTACRRTGTVGGAADRVQYAAGDFPAGGTSGTGAITSTRLSVSAVVESDADHDGYGDSTQDVCPGSPASDPRFPGPLGKPTGRAKVRKAVTAPVVATAPGVSTSYQWLRVSKKRHKTVTTPISGATGPTYQVRKKDRGKKLQVRVTLGGPGCASTSADSAPKKAR